MVGQKCVVCGAYGSWDLSLFQFPKDESSKTKWITRLNLDPENIRLNSNVCSNHFEKKHFVNRQGTRLKNNVVPNLIGKVIRNIQPATIPISSNSTPVENATNLISKITEFRRVLPKYIPSENLTCNSESATNTNQLDTCHQSTSITLESAKQFIPQTTSSKSEFGASSLQSRLHSSAVSLSAKTCLLRRQQPYSASLQSGVKVDATTTVPIDMKIVGFVLPSSNSLQLTENISNTDELNMAEVVVKPEVDEHVQDNPRLMRMKKRYLTSVRRALKTTTKVTRLSKINEDFETPKISTPILDEVEDVSKQEIIDVDTPDESNPEFVVLNSSGKEELDFILPNRTNLSDTEVNNRISLKNSDGSKLIENFEHSQPKIYRLSDPLGPEQDIVSPIVVTIPDNTNKLKPNRSNQALGKLSNNLTFILPPQRNQFILPKNFIQPTTLFNSSNQEKDFIIEIQKQGLESLKTENQALKEKAYGIEDLEKRFTELKKKFRTAKQTISRQSKRIQRLQNPLLSPWDVEKVLNGIFAESKIVKDLVLSQYRRYRKGYSNSYRRLTLYSNDERELGLTLYEKIGSCGYKKLRALGFIIPCCPTIRKHQKINRCKQSEPNTNDNESVSAIMPLENVEYVKIVSEKNHEDMEKLAPRKSPIKDAAAMRKQKITKIPVQSIRRKMTQ